MRMKMYNLEEEEMQDLVNRVQSGSPEAQDEILEVFSNLLWKYVQLLHNSRYNLKDSPETRSFISLYIKDPSLRHSLSKNIMTHDQYRAVNKVITQIQMMVSRYGDIEDTQQTIKMAFLSAVSNYKRTESKTKPGEFVPFAGYISFYLRYIIKKFVDEFLIDQNGLHTYQLKTHETPFDEEGDGESGGYEPDPIEDETFAADIIDEYWVIGDTAQYPFNKLTVQQRQLLKWRYVDNMKGTEIARKITEHTNTLREHYTKIRNILLEE